MRFAFPVQTAWFIFTLLGLLCTLGPPGHLDVVAVIFLSLAIGTAIGTTLKVITTILFQTNDLPKEDEFCIYSHLFMAVVMWTVSIGTILFEVWLMGGEFETLDWSDHPILEWIRLTSSAILAICGVGQGSATAKSFQTEALLAVLVGISRLVIGICFFCFTVAYHHFAQQKEYRAQ